MHPASLLWLISQASAPPAIDVQWTAPAECPDRDALLAAVTRRLTRPLAGGEARVEARVVGDRSRGYTLHLTLSAGARGEVREVHDPSCAALTDAAAVRVVAAIEAPPVVPIPPEPEPAPEPASAPAPAPTLEVVPAEPVRTSAIPELPPAPSDMYDGPGGVLRLHGGGEVGALPGRAGSEGALPGPAGAVGLALGLLWPRLRLELQGTVLPGRSGGGVKAGLYAGSVHACWRVGRGKLEVPLCGGVEVGAMRGEPTTSLPGASANTSLWLAGAVGPALSWHVSPRVSVWAGLQLVLAPVRPEFQKGEDVEGMMAERLYLPSLASGRLLLGVELRIRDRW
jgi:hypothetical protein